jgi:hypothetical protein
MVQFIKRCGFSSQEEVQEYFLHHIQTGWAHLTSYAMGIGDCNFI